MKWLKRTYQFLFTRKSLFNFHLALFHLSLRGMGILNYESKVDSGEDFFIKKYIKGKEKKIIRAKQRYMTTVIKILQDMHRCIRMS